MRRRWSRTRTAWCHIPINRSGLKPCARLLGSGLVQAQPDGFLPTRAELETVHTPALLDFLAGRGGQLAPGQEYAYPEIFPIRAEMCAGTDGCFAFDPYSPIGRETWTAAQASAGLALEGARAVLAGSPAALALCRPPGHHAGTDFYGGYCYLNNAALAARTLQARGRVAVLDVDYHHGNGTQSIFWDDAAVFTASIHGDPAFEYPSYSGFARETGGSQAQGGNLNLPLPAGTDGATYRAALERMLETARRFDPQTVVVSLGFDTAEADAVGTFRLRPLDFFALGQALAGLKRPTLFVQEGGYALEAIADLAEQFFSGFLQG